VQRHDLKVIAAKPKDGACTASAKWLKIKNPQVFMS
jgi:hypothetical protein